jgi:hypothetical protein
VRLSGGLLQTTLEAHHGNRTHASRAHGLEPMCLIRLMRDRDVGGLPRANSDDMNAE